MGRYAIVDKENRVIGFKKHSDILKSDIYRVSVLWVTNSKKQILLAKRALNKSHDPGLWEPAAAGTVEIDETYRENIIKEAEEEIGLVIDKKKLLEGPVVFLNKDTGWQFFCQIFLYNTDKNISQFTLQSDEVMDLRWFDKTEFENKLKLNKSKFVSNIEFIYQHVQNTIH